MKKLTITVEDDVYQGLHAVIGRGKISSYLNGLARPHVVDALESGYAAMAKDVARETEALTWSENLLADSQIDE